ncbi:YvcK family protein [Chloroflexi bacterium CFX3]|nr:YvcK family protein [Chloroflexi bacterium CFX3]
MAEQTAHKPIRTRPDDTWRKWLTPGLGIKRWLVLLAFGFLATSLSFALLIVLFFPALADLFTLRRAVLLALSAVLGALGSAALYIGFVRLNRSILAPFARGRRQRFIDVMVDHARQANGLRLVALGGGSGLPSVLRGFKGQTQNITAIVTVADDGGSTGKLREEYGVLAPGDLRQNIAALADDESLITQLFQYRFNSGGLQGHSFGNLFLTALADITGSMDQAVIEASRVYLARCTAWRRSSHRRARLAARDRRVADSECRRQHRARVPHPGECPRLS